MFIEVPDSVLSQMPAYKNPEELKIDFAAWLYQRD
jgi:hypothetical protein